MSAQIVGGLDGARALTREMDKAQRQLANMTPQMTKAARVVAARGQTTAPRRTGRLASSVRGKGGPDQAQIGSSLVYAPVIHWGWPGHNIEPQPWLVQAAEQTQPQQISYFEEMLDDMVTKMAAST